MGIIIFLVNIINWVLLGVSIIGLICFFLIILDFIANIIFIRELDGICLKIIGSILVFLGFVVPWGIAAFSFWKIRNYFVFINIWKGIFVLFLHFAIIGICLFVIYFSYKILDNFRHH